MHEGQLSALRRAWASAPHDAEAGQRLAQALYATGEFDAAAEVLVAARDVCRDPHQLVEIGRKLESVGALADALSAYQAAVALDPIHADAHGFAGAVHLRLGTVQEAQASLRRWASLSEDAVEAHFGLATSLVEHEELAAAADHLQIALDLNPGHVAAQELLGIVLGEQGDLQGSVEAWRAARLLAPSSPQTASGLGVALSRAGRHEEAIRLLEVGALGSTERCRLGVSLRAIGEVGKALEVLQAAIESDPEHAALFAQLGQTQLQAERAQEAVSSLMRAAELSPRDGGIHHWLGRALIEVGRRPQALAALLKAAALLPEDPELQADLEKLQSELRGDDPAQPTPASAEMSGHLDVVTLPNLLEFLTTNGSSGLLFIESEGRQAHVYLDQGRIAAAQTTDGPRLGDVLVASGDISREQVEAACSGADDCTVARALLERGLVPEDTLSERMDEQIVEVLTRIVTWPKGAFRFRRGDQLTDKAHCPHGLDARFALMEVMRRLDEQKAGRSNP